MLISIRNLCLYFNNGYSYLKILYDNPSINVKNPSHNNMVGIDPGLKNHVSIACDNGDSKSLLIRNSAINRINNYTSTIIDRINKELAPYYDKKTFNGMFKKLKIIKGKLIHKRDVILKNEMHKMTNRIIDYSKKNKVGTIVYGYNKGLKQKGKLGKENNRKFHGFPHYKLLTMLRYKCPSNGITLIEQEESYTSKLSCISDGVWNYIKGINDTNVSNGIRGVTFKGKKIRSLFKDKITKKVFHSDINGAYNILQKYMGKHVDKYWNQLCNPITIKNDFEFMKEL